jgi:hypothetical protein
MMQLSDSKKIKGFGRKVFNSKTEIVTASKSLIPIFSGSPVSELVDEILRENEYIRNELIQNPNYRELLEEKVKDSVKKYTSLLKGAKAIDHWDRITSALGLASEFIPVLGNVVSALEEGIELIPKAIYALKYKKIVGNKTDLKYWGAAEAASFIPYIGDFIDMSNLYLNRARKSIKENIQKDFLTLLSKSRNNSLEKKVRLN